MSDFTQQASRYSVLECLAVMPCRYANGGTVGDYTYRELKLKSTL